MGNGGFASVTVTTTLDTAAAIGSEAFVLAFPDSKYEGQ
jgi:hypothetical protein